MFASEATCTPMVASVVEIRAGIMFASEAMCTHARGNKRCSNKSRYNASLANIIPALILTTLVITGVHVASLANIIPALISTTLVITGVHVASLANIIPALILTTLVTTGVLRVKRHVRPW
jgi:uncharacterized membrane protein SirB2